MSIPADEAWHVLGDVVGDVTGQGSEGLSPETRLVADLNLDSLALVEVLVAVGADLHTLSDQLDPAGISWNDATLGDLHAALTRPHPAHRRSDELAT